MEREGAAHSLPADTSRRKHLPTTYSITMHRTTDNTFKFGLDVTVPKCPTFGQGSLRIVDTDMEYVVTRA